jgi:transcriptional regulator with AAA-type ATPase domain
MLFEASEAVFAQSIADLALANPFDPHEVARHEQLALGVDLPAETKKRMLPPRSVAERPNVPELLRRAEALAEVVRDRARCEEGSDAERVLYRDLVLFVLYFRYRDQLQQTVEQTLEEPGAGVDGGQRRGGRQQLSYFDEFIRDLRGFLGSLPSGGVTSKLAAHWFAGFFQIRRAFQLIHAQILGSSRPSARLRAAVWHSIFTHDLRRYRDVLYDRMHDLATLITGPSGTGKDLVAAAIGLSRYVAFNIRTRQFEDDFGGAFHPVNLSALPPQLIESELFGHCRGAFTGAVTDRVGWLESCRRCHSVFLDEIGELSPAIQVKLLRVLQNRTFQRLGEIETRRFEGKVIAATNRDLEPLIGEGAFRRDFYYRLCSDLIRTPSLQEQLHDDPGELPRLVGFIARRLLGDASDGLAREVVVWIEEHLGLDYSWPGNIRELEQCVRNILVRKEYFPLREKHLSGKGAFLTRVANVQVTAGELLDWYCTLAYSQTGSFVDAAQRLGMDRRTLRRRVQKV